MNQILRYLCENSSSYFIKLKTENWFTFEYTVSKIPWNIRWTFKRKMSVLSLVKPNTSSKIRLKWLSYRDTVSNTWDINTGDPQARVLLPLLLWIIYINEIRQIIFNCAPSLIKSADECGFGFSCQGRGWTGELFSWGWEIKCSFKERFLARNDPKTKELVLKSYLYKLFPLQWFLAVRW